MAIAQKIYDKAPEFLQNTLVSGAGYWQNRHRYGKKYWAYRKWLEDFDTWTLEQKIKFQNQQLHDFLVHSVTNSPFYADLYKGLKVADVLSQTDLVMLPVVDKELLRKNMSAVYATSSVGTHTSRTGGTTGKPLVVRVTDEDSMRRTALLDHFKARQGFENRKMRRASFPDKKVVPPGHTSGTFWRYNRATKQMLYSTRDITEESLPLYVASLNRFKPAALDGYTSSIVDVADYIVRNDLKLDFKPIAIFPTAEPISDAERKMVQQAFGAPIFNQYASSEGAPLVTECREGTLHLEVDSGIIEPRTETSDEILVTCFMTHGTPLVRYAIGDSMKLGPNLQCECGLASPTILTIGGRSRDYLVRQDGAKINMSSVAQMLLVVPKGIIRTQLVQDNRDAIAVKILTDPDLFEAEYNDLLVNAFHQVFGADMEIFLEHVAEIPRASSGKHRLIVNNIGGSA